MVKQYLHKYNFAQVFCKILRCFYDVLTQGRPCFPHDCKPELPDAPHTIEM